MDNERARIILSAYRSGGMDANDPLFREALEQARLDPELGRWFAGQQAFDAQMHRAVKAVRPPEHLKAAILLSSKMTPRASSPRRRLINPSWLALAAAVAIFAGVSLLFSTSTPRPIALSAVTDRIVQLQNQLPGALGLINTDTTELQHWLAQHKGPHDFDIPAGLADKNGVGCQVFSINGNKVSLICFQLSDKRIVHYLVIDRDRLTNPPPIGKPILLDEKGVAMMAWSDERRSYVLAEFSDVNQLKPLL